MNNNQQVTDTRSEPETDAAEVKNKRHKMDTKHRDEQGNRHGSLSQSLTFTRSFWVSVRLNAVFVHLRVHNLHLFITLFDARLPCTGLGASGRGQKLKTNMSGAIERSRSTSKRPHFPLELHVRQTNQAVGAEIVQRTGEKSCASGCSLFDQSPHASSRTGCRR